jgi:hypothetical protein
MSVTGIRTPETRYSIIGRLCDQDYRQLVVLAVRINPWLRAHYERLRRRKASETRARCVHA